MINAFWCGLWLALSLIPFSYLEYCVWIHFRRGMPFTVMVLLACWAAAYYHFDRLFWQVYKRRD